MKAMIAAHGDQYPTELQQVPQPSVEEIEKDPKLAGFTYQRQQCQRCHVGVKGREKRGDYRGMGCSSCHIPYGNEGYYEGKDPTINKEQKGHMLIHKIQATRKTKIKHGDGNIFGTTLDEKEMLGQSRMPDAIDMAPVQPHSAQRKARTCESCHNNPKAMGYGISGGVFQTRYPVDIVEDLDRPEDRPGDPRSSRDPDPQDRRPGLRLVDHYQGRPAGPDRRYPLAAVTCAAEGDA